MYMLAFCNKDLEGLRLQDLISYRSLHLLYSLLSFEQGTFENGEIGFQGTFLGKEFVISRVIVEVGRGRSDR
jgi:hypothetical protein